MKKYINKKIIVVSILLLIAILIVIILLSLKKTNNFIVIDNKIIEYNSNYEFKKANIDDAVGKTFRMIYQNKYIGNFVLDHEDKDYNVLMFKTDEEDKAIKSPYLGINDEIVYYDLEKQDMNEEDFEDYKPLLNEDINYKLTDLSYGYKYNVKDTNIVLYIVLYEGKTPEEDFSIFYVKNGNKFIVLDEDLPQKEDGGYKFTVFGVEHIVDINNDNKLELIVSKSHYDELEYSIYKLYDNFEELYYTGE